MDGAAAVDRYVRHQERLGRFRPSTARQTRYLLRSWLRHVEDWEHPQPDEATEWVIVPASCDGKHRRGSCVRAFYVYAYSHHWLDVNHSAAIPAVRGSGKAPKPCPDAVLSRAMRGASPALRDAMVLGRFAGLRAGEIAAVRRGDMHAGLLRVEGKGGRERFIPTHPQVREVVGGHSGWVFPGRAGHVTAGTMSRWLRDALPDPWTGHTLRHAFATDLYDRTRDIVLTAEILGHESTRTTERYIRVRADRAGPVIAEMRLVA